MKPLLECLCHWCKEDLRKRLKAFDKKIKKIDCEYMGSEKFLSESEVKEVIKELFGTIENIGLEEVKK